MRVPDEPLAVLVVDDEPSIREIVRFLLTDDDRFTVTGEAANGEEAIRMATELQPDVVLLDLMMPVMDGMTALPQIRAAAPDGIIVVVLSALDLRRKADEAEAAGAAGYIPKSKITTVPDVLAEICLGGATTR